MVHPGKPRKLLAALAVAVAVAATAIAVAFSGAPETAAPPGFAPAADQARLGAGKPIEVRRGGGAPARRGRAERRRSLAYFAALTDPQIADEMSPALFDFLAPRRAHEAFGLQTFDQAVRSVNARAVSNVPAAGAARARLGFAVMTGDLSDNHQANEVRSGVRVLDGGRVDPFSGKRISPANPCPRTSRADIARLNARVSRRAYTGVQDYRNWPDRPPTAYRRYWDPRAPAAGGGPYAAYPRHPGLMDRAQRPFAAPGLAVKWYSVRGNHDANVLGRYSARQAFPARIATGCRKVFPGGPPVRGADPVTLLRSRLGRATRVPPDPARRFVSVPEFKRLHRGADRGHGFGYVRGDELRRSRGAASYYAFSPSPGLRFVGIDTVADGGGSRGNLDHPQYRWLARELDRNSSVELSRSGAVRRDGDRDRLIVVYGHHTLLTMTRPVPDEKLPRCTRLQRRGCDLDPRPSTPMHLGLSGRGSLRALLLRHPNVVLYVAGHIHKNRVVPYFRKDRRGGLWQVATAGHMDAPQQSRLLELMRNYDGTLSVFTTLLDHAAPARPPPPGTPGKAFTNADLGSLSRILAANVPRRGRVTELRRARGGRADRPVELLLRDPRRLD